MVLKEQHCQPQQGPALDPAQTGALLAQAPGWTVVAGSTIEREFSFPDFHRTMAFVNAVAWIAHVQDHHPELRVSYTRCTVRYTTHSVNGLSINDFICAAQVDALLP
ncbi:4a-hydroxytetrahydrobiopterin dehydratase [Ideonella sp. BN130291]|uniref:4a-hydroxytetrahydrobiopterin dehydratase n=1 Tax=Ideonella sp. BN130291 TaxID=3112940 RepID=UPI002E270B36|nr:4a-hydroxytetrahydrobiopterin dehydratase [Ideonella sp. BN130291]